MAAAGRAPLVACMEPSFFKVNCDCKFTFDVPESLIKDIEFRVIAQMMQREDFEAGRTPHEKVEKHIKKEKFSDDDSRDDAEEV